MNFLEEEKQTHELKDLEYLQSFIIPNGSEYYYINLGRSDVGFNKCIGIHCDDETIHDIYELDEHETVYPVVATKIKYRGVEL